jgi:uncharacterized protein (TIGR03382 family)
MAPIEQSERVGWILLAASMAIAGASISFIKKSKRETWASIWLGALLVSHPGWWMSAREGDCGKMRLFTSIGATAAMVLLALVLWVRSRRKLAS